MLRGSLFFFFNDPATTEIYPLSLHDALPISQSGQGAADSVDVEDRVVGPITTIDAAGGQLTVLGQTISVTASTSFGPGITPADLTGLKMGDGIEVSGLAGTGGVLMGPRLRRTQG